MSLDTTGVKEIFIVGDLSEKMTRVGFCSMKNIAM